MKIFKHIETGHIAVETNPNHYSIFERMGYKEIVDEVKEVKTVKKVKKKKSE